METDAKEKVRDYKFSLHSIIGCQNYCPAHCMAGFKSCPTLIDDLGCVLQEDCFPADEACPGVPDNCPAGEQLCLLSPELGRVTNLSPWAKSFLIPTEK